MFKRSLLKPLLLFLVVSWPFSNFLIQNGHRFISYCEIITPLFFLLTFFLIVVCVANHFLQKVFFERFFFSLLFALLAIFSFQAIADLYGNLLDSSIIEKLELSHIKFSYIWFFSVCAFIYGVWQFSEKEPSNNIFIVFILVITTVPFVKAVHVFLSNTEEVFSFPDDIDRDLAFQKKPNVYFVLLDAYTREDILKKELAYDNTPFIDSLRKRGFWIQNNSFSNYHFTLASLSSMFAMSFHKPSDGFFHPPQFYQAWKGPHAVGEIFKNNGYKFVFIEPGPWGDIGCSGYEDFCKTCRTRFLNDSVHNILMMTPFGRFSFFKSIRQYTLLQDADGVWDLLPQKPKFFYIHSALVHDSMYDAEGHIKKMPTCIGIKDKKSAKAYVDSIRGINKDLMKLIDSIKKNDSGAIIMLCSDHGAIFYHTSKEVLWTSYPSDKCSFQKQYANFNAVYIPEFNNNQKAYERYFWHDITPVNYFRPLFSYLSGKMLSRLPDMCYFIQYNKMSKKFYLPLDEDLRQKFGG